MICNQDKSKVLLLRWTEPLQRQRPVTAKVSEAALQERLWWSLGYSRQNTSHSAKAATNTLGCLSRSTASGSDSPPLLSTC